MVFYLGMLNLIDLKLIREGGAVNLKLIEGITEDRAPRCAVHSDITTMSIQTGNIFHSTFPLCSFINIRPIDPIPDRCNVESVRRELEEIAANLLVDINLDPLETAAAV